MASVLFERPVRVLEIGDSIAVSFCGRLLTQLGAEVRKIEQPGGSPLRRAAPRFRGAGGEELSALFEALNVDKQLVECDLDAASGRVEVEAAVRSGVDIVLMSGTLAEWAARALSPARIRALAPSAVLGRVTMFGDDGPYAGLAGGELQAQALGGLMHLVGEPDREPLRLGGYQAQYSTGLALLTGVAIGLHHREVTGSGSAFSTSVLETVAHVEWKGAVSYQADGTIVTRGPDGAPAILRAADGYLAFYYRPADWPKLLQLFDDPRLAEARFASPAARGTHRAELVAVLEDCTSRLAKREVYHRAQQLGLTIGYAATVTDLLHSPQYTAREFLRPVTVARRPGVLPGPPWRVAATAVAPVPAPPRSSRPGARHAGLLDGLRVFDLSIVTAGAAGTQILADFGAEVIKVEAPARPDLFRGWTDPGEVTGDLHSAPFRTANRNKRGFAVDLKTPAGLALARRLIAECDVVVENFRQGVLDRLGLGFDELVKIRPDIVLVSVASQGTTGPNRRYGSFGSTVDGLGGLMSVTGYDERTPLWSSNKVNYPDQTASLLGPALVVLGVLSARTSGHGKWIDLSQREIITAMLGEQVLRASLDGIDPVPQANQGGDGLEWATRCVGEDEWLTVSLLGPTHRRALAVVLGDADLASAADEVVRDAVAAWSCRRTKREAMSELQAAGVPAAAVLKGFELLTDPYFSLIEWFRRAPRPDGGSELQRGRVVRFDATPELGTLRRAPHVGEHTVEIMSELLGCDDEEIRTLLEAGVVLDGRVPVDSSAQA